MMLYSQSHGSTAWVLLSRLWVSTAQDRDRHIQDIFASLLHSGSGNMLSPFAQTSLLKRVLACCVLHLLCLCLLSRFKATLWLSESHPLSLAEQVTPIIDLMAISNAHFAKLRDFITLRLPPGFPVKIGGYETRHGSVSTFGQMDGFKPTC